MDSKKKKLIKLKIEHEDSLKNSRISWLTASQALLINVSFSKKIPSGHYNLFISLIGLITTIIIGIIIWSGLKSISLLKYLYYQEQKKVDNKDIVFLGYAINPKGIIKDSKVRTIDIFLYLSIPCIFIIYWMYSTLKQLCIICN